MAFGGGLRLTGLGWGLALPVLILALIGLLCIHATDEGLAPPAPSPLGFSTAPAIPAEAEPWPVQLWQSLGSATARQIGFILTGLLLMGLTLLPSYQRLGPLAFVLYGLVLALLVLQALDRVIDVPLVEPVRGTRRWFGAGFFRIQPSEFMKPVLILALARYLRYRSSFRTLPGLVPPFLLTLIPMVLILLQPDLGTLLMLLPTLFVMLWVAGARPVHLGAIIALGCATLPAFYFLGMHEYQRQRIDVLLRQRSADEAWHMGPGYQLRQSKIALGTGGVLGEGYARGVFVEYRQRDLLPEEHNDFIFAIIGHQWGLFGCVLVLLAYGVIALCGMEVATLTNDPFGRLLAVGVVTMIVIQALLNICMTIGLAPITGMPLPFVSAGGSSLWANFIALGLLVNVAQRRPMLIAQPPFQHAND
jgi:rod shape determining protein RodA